jgi:hypothetical protein
MPLNLSTISSPKQKQRDREIGHPREVGKIPSIWFCLPSLEPCPHLCLYSSLASASTRWITKAAAGPKLDGSAARPAYELPTNRARGVGLPRQWPSSSPSSSWARAHLEFFLLESTIPNKTFGCPHAFQLGRSHAGTERFVAWMYGRDMLSSCKRALRAARPKRNVRIRHI